jgi:hypothetical protein
LIEYGSPIVVLPFAPFHPIAGIPPLDIASKTPVWKNPVLNAPSWKPGLADVPTSRLTREFPDCTQSARAFVTPTVPVSIGGPVIARVAPVVITVTPPVEVYVGAVITFSR